MVQIPDRFRRFVAAVGMMWCVAAQPTLAGGNMRIAVSVLPVGTGGNGLYGNPYQGITLPGVMALQAIFDTLTTLDPQGNAIPALATAWQAEDPMHWRFTLRPGVKFSNGEPFDAEAVVESVKHLTSEEGRSETIGSTLYQLGSAEAVDPLTVRITLREPDPLFPIHAAIWRIAAPKLFAQLGPQRYGSNPVGTGPFVLDRRSDSILVLKANKASWRAPKLDMITLTRAAETFSRVQALTSGGVDVAYRLDPEFRTAVEQAGGRIHEGKAALVYFLGFATLREKSPLKDPRVRRALNMAVNKQSIIDHVFAGATTPAAQLSFSGAFGFDPTLKPLPYDPVAAKKLLADAGYPNGLSLKMGASNGDTAANLLAYQEAASDLAKIGVRVEIMLQPSVRLQQDQFTGRLEVDLFNSFSRGTDPIIDYRHRSCVSPVRDREPYHCDPEIVATVKKALAEQNLDKRAALYRQIAAQEQQSPPGLFLWQGLDYDGLGPKVKTYTPFQDVLNVHEWDLK